MTEKFFIKIDAESPDGEAVRCETQVSVACTTNMAVSIIANLMKQDENLKEIFTKALVMTMAGAINTQEISDEEYAKRGNDVDSDLEF